jgi:hypothetical protein
MRGEIVDLDAMTGDGRILTADGRHLDFRATACRDLRLIGRPGNRHVR